MKKITLLLILALFCGVSQTYAKKKENKDLSYEIKCAGTGQQGYFLVEVTALATDKSDVNLDFAKKCAVHGVLFQGVAAEPGCSAQRPMVGAVKEQEYGDFFNKFFKHDYLRYASAADSAIKTVKCKNGRQVIATILVAKDELRKTMENAGVLSKLGF